MQFKSPIFKFPGLIINFPKGLCSTFKSNSLYWFFNHWGWLTKVVYHTSLWRFYWLNVKMPYYKWFTSNIFGYSKINLRIVNIWIRILNFEWPNIFGYSIHEFLQNRIYSDIRFVHFSIAEYIWRFKYFLQIFEKNLLFKFWFSIELKPK